MRVPMVSAPGIEMLILDTPPGVPESQESVGVDPERVLAGSLWGR